MKVVIDIEANGLENPTQIWCIVCKDIDTGELHIFRNLVDDLDERKRFQEFLETVEKYIGHNILEYDLPILNRLINCRIDYHKVIDTLVLSRLIYYSRSGGHSIEQYGLEFNFPKINFTDFSKYSKEMEDYCVRDVEICHLIYLKYLHIINDPAWAPSIRLEHDFQEIVNRLHDNGFSFNVNAASELLERVNSELKLLDEEIARAFPPRLRLVREIKPTWTKHGTLHKKDFRWVKDGDLTPYWGDFCLCKWEEFNPSSHKQIIEVLTEAGWKPVNKTKTHVVTERELNRSYFSDTELDLNSTHDKLRKLEKFGWKIDEENLATLPDDAPAPARSLAKRILLEARRRTLTEWLSLVNPKTGRIHGKFYGIGAWTHRMAHQRPNTANIPTGAKLFGDEMRALWCAAKKRLLVGVDAEGIQLRIFAHYIDDAEFTLSLVQGKKEDKTDPHSLNKRILGDVCRGRQEAKRFIYALLLGAGLGKLSEILGCDREAARAALDRLMGRYQGFLELKQNHIPRDAKRGWFRGLDGRQVLLPGASERDRGHLCMSGYLQNGEAIVMKKACLLWHNMLREDKELLEFLWFIVNFVHDEWQTEVDNNIKLALKVAKTQADSLRLVGEELNLRCPLAGSFWNDDLKDYTIGVNWSVTH